MHFTSYMNIFISNWVLLVAGLMFSLPMIHLRVENHTVSADRPINLKPVIE